MGSPTECLTLSSSEFPSGAAACSLSDILETGALPPRFYLSPKACAGILRRAEKRGKRLPERLRRALERTAGLGTSDPLDTVVAPTLSGNLKGDHVGREGHLVAYGGNNQSGPIDVATAVTAHGGPHGRQDFESETFIHAFDARQADVLQYGEVAGPLDVDAYSQAICFDPTMLTNPHCRHNPAPGAAAPPLLADGAPLCLALDLRNCAIDGETAHTVQAGSVAPGVVPHLLEGYTLHGSSKTRSTASPAETATALRAKPPGGMENSSTTAVLHDGIRRLTPRECERLQGMPDDYTLIRYRGRPGQDGPRYRCLGNSKAVPVVRWIGERIDAVDRVIRSGQSCVDPYNDGWPAARANDWGCFRDAWAELRKRLLAERAAGVAA